jgi:hypothetical protein
MTAAPVRIVRDAGLSALVALGLFAGLIGLRLFPTDDGLQLRARVGALAAVVAAVFVGRLGWRC